MIIEVAMALTVVRFIFRIMSGFKDEVIVERSRYAWKYAASRGVTGTPSFLINGELQNAFNVDSPWSPMWRMLDALD